MPTMMLNRCFQLSVPRLSPVIPECVNVRSLFKRCKSALSQANQLGLQDKLSNCLPKNLNNEYQTHHIGYFPTCQVDEEARIKGAYRRGTCQGYCSPYIHKQAGIRNPCENNQEALQDFGDEHC